MRQQHLVRPKFNSLKTKLSRAKWKHDDPHGHHLQAMY